MGWVMKLTDILSELFDNDLILESLKTKGQKLVNDGFFILTDYETYMLCEGDDLFSFVQLTRSNKGLALTASNALKSGYGIFVYESVLMGTYPQSVRSDPEQSSGDDLYIWERYLDRPDVEHEKMEPYEYQEIIDNMGYVTAGQKHWFKKKPESWFKKLVERGDELMDNDPELYKRMFGVAKDSWGEY